MKLEKVHIEEVEPPASRRGAHHPTEIAGGVGKAFSLTLAGDISPKLKRVSGFFTSAKAREFKKRFFKEATNSEWSDWHWQMRNSIGSLDKLARIIQLSADERAALTGRNRGFPCLITPYYASLIAPENPLDPIRRTVVPVTAEQVQSPGEQADPLGEEMDSPVPGLVHRYPDRVLFLVSDFCSTYCRYCTRSRMVGRVHFHDNWMDRLNRALAYIESNPRIRDVLISGGDPLVLSDDQLEWILSKLRRIPHVEVVRIGTKAPIVLPQRITTSLVRMLKRYHPLWMSIHCTHPDELTGEVWQACERLADSGIPLQSQTVLLAGINDDTETMRRLFHGLVRMRVRPYYLYQCDPIIGSAHFRTPVSMGLGIMRGLRGYTSGFAVPLYVIDAPGGGGKVPIMPEYVVGHEGNDIMLRNFEGKEYRYPDEHSL